MMQTTQMRRLDRLAQRHEASTRTHLVWQDIGESEEAVALRIREMKESGRASENDRFVICGWGKRADRAAGAPFESKP
jgi:hypothetical protein